MMPALVVVPDTMHAVFTASPIMMRTEHARLLQVGQAVSFFDLVNLVNYAATVTAVTQHSLTVTVPGRGGMAKTFSLDSDAAAMLNIRDLF